MSQSVLTAVDHDAAGPARPCAPPTPASVSVRLRRFPHRYDAMLAICSDLDYTADGGVYREIARYLNTREPTAMGPGVGLEVGNSIFFDMPPAEFAYWNTDDAGREMVRTLIRSGHIDVLHSYGDLARTRADAERALAELDRHALHLPVWVDHRRAPSNFGADIMRGEGDRPGAPCYHADLTLAHGVRYVWRGRVTSVVGQQAPHSLRGVWNGRRPACSARTLAKEAAKHVLGRVGRAKYAMHRDNALLRPITLRDGAGCVEFLRSNPHWAGISRADTAAGLADVLSDPMLDRLARRGAVAVLYTHLAKKGDPRRPFDEPTCAAFRRLARRHEAGHVLVTTTHRLLRYIDVRDHLTFRATADDGRVTVHIGPVVHPVRGSCTPSLDELQGLTFLVDARAEVEVRAPSGERLDCTCTYVDGATCATIPWKPLTFPTLDRR